MRPIPQSAASANSMWRPRGAAAATHEVAIDARSQQEQLAEYTAYVACITAHLGHDLARSKRAADKAREHVVAAFCLCEDVHGYGAIAIHTLFAGALIACAQQVHAGGIVRASTMAGHANTGLLIGLLIEQMAGIAAHKRKFHPAVATSQDTSPYANLGDCILGVSVARMLGALSPEVLVAGVPYAALAHQARRALGTKGREMVREICMRASHAPDPVQAFITEVLATPELGCAQLSAMWNSHVSLCLTGRNT